MNKNRFLNTLHVIAIMIIAGCFAIGCSQENFDSNDDSLSNNDIILQDIPNDLKNYFSSQDYYDLKNNFEVTLGDFSFGQVKIENISGVNLYYLPVNKGKNISGLLCVFSKDNGKIYKSLYEDRTELNTKDGGKVSIYTAKNFFVADFKYNKIDNRTARLRIDRVGDVEISTPRLKGGVEWPSPDDGWWSCTTDCCSYCQDACQGDPECGFLLDLVDGLGTYTGSLSIVAACAAYCF
jgi:hypothetical protein